MIYVLTGENSFAIDRELKQIAAEFGGEVETIDGNEVTIERMPSLLSGRTLFSEQRLVVIRGLSENASIWSSIDTWLQRADEAMGLVLVEGKLDKRLSVYKWLKAHVQVREFPVWTSRDTARAVAWAQEEAVRQNVTLTSALATILVARTGLDQWRIFRSLEKLALAGEVSQETIDEVVERHPDEQIFELIETALRRDTARLAGQIASLRQTEDAYKLSGLLFSQILQLAALALSDRPAAEVASETGAHPFVLSKLAPYARQRGSASVKRLIERAAQTDTDMKTTSIDPWILVERLLLEIVND